MQLGYELLKGYKRHLFDHGKRAATVNCYESDAKSFIDFLFKLRPDGSLEGLEDLAAFQDQLEIHQSESQNSIRRKIIGIKSFLRFAIPRATGMASGFDEYPIPARIDGLPDGLDPEDLDALLNAAHRQVPALKGLAETPVTMEFSVDIIQAMRLLEHFSRNGVGDKVNYNFAAVIDFSAWLPAMHIDKKGALPLNLQK